MKLRLFKLHKKHQARPLRHTRVVAKRQVVVRLVLLNRQKFCVPKQRPRPLPLYPQAGHHMPVLKNLQHPTVKPKGHLFQLANLPINSGRLSVKRLLAKSLPETDSRLQSEAAAATAKKTQTRPPPQKSTEARPKRPAAASTAAQAKAAVQPYSRWSAGQAPAEPAQPARRTPSASAAPWRGRGRQPRRHAAPPTA